MPSLQDNKDIWNDKYDWKQMGDEWSVEWGGPDTEWYATLLPRIHRYIPTGTILEIAPGFGRWTQFLKDFCQHLILVDLSDKCIDACKDRFHSCPHIEYHVNDGKSLDFIADESIDFAFSFDSLVHCEDEVIKAYVDQLARKLRKNGVGFIHHSNLGEYISYYSLLRKFPGGISRFLGRIGLVDPILDPWRAPSMSAGKLKQYAEAAGLQCVTQEKINWATRRLIDCISVFRRQDSSCACSTKIIRNHDFMREVRYASSRFNVYGASPSKDTKASA